MHFMKKTYTMNIYHTWYWYYFKNEGAALILHCANSLFCVRRRRTRGQSFAQCADDEMLCAALSLCEASDAGRWPSPARPFISRHPALPPIVLTVHPASFLSLQCWAAWWIWRWGPWCAPWWERGWRGRLWRAWMEGYKDWNIFLNTIIVLLEIEEPPSIRFVTLAWHKSSSLCLLS